MTRLHFIKPYSRITPNRKELYKAVANFLGEDEVAPKMPKAEKEL